MVCSREKPRMEPGHTREDEIGPRFPPPEAPVAFDACTPRGGGLPYRSRRHHDCDGNLVRRVQEER
jgi:hypothetical protein